VELDKLRRIKSLLRRVSYLSVRVSASHIPQDSTAVGRNVAVASGGEQQ
jgi:hypothetical protein